MSETVINAKEIDGDFDWNPEARRTVTIEDKRKFIDGFSEAANKARALETILEEARKKAPGLVSGVATKDLSKEELEKIALANYNFRMGWRKVPFRILGKEWDSLTKYWGHDLSEPIFNPYSMAASSSGLELKEGEALQYNPEMAVKIDFVFDPVFPRIAGLIMGNFRREAERELARELNVPVEDNGQEVFDLMELNQEIVKLLLIRHEYQRVMAQEASGLKVGKLEYKQRKISEGSLLSRADKGAIARGILNFLTNGIKSVKSAWCDKGETGKIAVWGMKFRNKEGGVMNLLDFYDNGLGFNSQAVFLSALKTGNLSFEDYGRIPYGKGADVAGELIFEDEVTGYSQLDGIGGSGSGLATARRLIEENGGQVGHIVNNTPDQGARISFTLPVAKREKI